MFSCSMKDQWFPYIRGLIGLGHLEAFLNNEGHSLPRGDDSSSIQGGDLTRDDAMPDAKGEQKSLEHEKMGEDHEWTDIEYLNCPPTLVAFLLDEKVWANVQVEHLTDIVWPERPFDSLGLEIGKKVLIQNLTCRFKTKEVTEVSNQDTGGVQGGNLCIFLTGPPGVGKTLTAEVVAEETHRPLYRVQAGGLGFHPSALEKQLGDIFLLARRWGAIILIDEADMFMTKRRASTPDQNATVTAFLRLFHTYDGLLFLTSTSKDIDTAFYDRIHATIEYTELDKTQRKNIWRRQLQRAIGSPEGHPPNSPWPEAYRLLGKVGTNGREIRNIVRTAEQLALGLSTDLSMKHVALAVRNFGGSDNYPRNAEEVSKTVQALVATPECNFAVRSGGHTVWPGASNIQDGITIDLDGRMVAGGRENAVGIGGLTTDGGKTFYTCRVGFACDQVVNYEVVLADGSIVQANDQEHSDLFRVLKGGGNNFGIVTGFDMVTFPSKDIWDAELVHAKESAPEVVHALTDFVGNLEAHPDAHVLAMWMYLPKADDHFIENLLMSLDGEQEAKSLSKFLAIPGQVKSKTTTIATKMDTFALPKAREHTWFTTTFKNDPRISQKAADVFESLVKMMKGQVPDHDFAFQMVLQPLPVSFGKHSAVRGGNMFGLEHIKDDCVLLVWTVEVPTPEMRTTVAFPALKGAIDEIEAYAKSLNSDVKFRYLNYCDASQDPLGSYGEENVRKMREAAEKYDPAGFSKEECPVASRSQRRTWHEAQMMAAVTLRPIVASMLSACMR
ncbi:FAD binding domain-containing protein [Colletotrichum chrysophilum]|uniref:FAD binding domain-containing protein n=1 Tax=Colletotrichum chrysophilum TaxID=1836956 RepID=A0AAD9EKK0_9PEZI|nr:FAD binding domain-containing protein [Colletotrichum chrysophilum]